MTQNNLTVTAQPSDFIDMHCAMTYWRQGTDPTVSLLMARVVPIGDAFSLADQKRNDHLQHELQYATQITMMAVYVGTRLACENALRAYMVYHGTEPLVQPFEPVSRVPMAIECDGKIYANQSQAAKALNLAQSQISKHLLNPTKHASVKGYTFRYVKP